MISIEKLGRANTAKLNELFNTRNGYCITNSNQFILVLHHFHPYEYYFEYESTSLAHTTHKMLLSFIQYYENEHVSLN